MILFKMQMVSDNIIIAHLFHFARGIRNHNVAFFTILYQLIADIKCNFYLSFASVKEIIIGHRALKFGI